MFKIVARAKSLEDFEKTVARMVGDGWTVHTVGRGESGGDYWAALVKVPKPVPSMG